MKKTTIVLLFVVFVIGMIFQNEAYCQETQIIVYVKGSNPFYEGDVFIDGNLYQSRVSSVRIITTPGSHSISVNGYVRDTKGVAHDVGKQTKNVTVEMGKTAEVTFHY